MSFNFNFNDSIKGASSAAARAKRAAAKAKRAAAKARKTSAKVKRTSRRVSNNTRQTTNNIRNTRSNISRTTGRSGSSRASYSHPATVSRSSGTGTSGVASAASAVYTPPPPPKPPSEKEWLAGDSTYQDQQSEYTRALQEFIARIGEREGEIKEDAKLALAANARNRTQGLNNNAEDFASRGLINSGLFADSSEKMSDRYNESKGAIETNRSRGLGSLADERSNYEREVELGRNNARRSALQRMAAQYGTL